MNFKKKKKGKNESIYSKKLILNFFLINKIEN